MRSPLAIGPRSAQPNPKRRSTGALQSAFTLIEILVVCGIIGIVMTIAIPTIYRQFHPDSMQKVVTELMEGCSLARGSAILNGAPVDLVFRAEDGLITLQPAGSGSIRLAEPAAPEGDLEAPSPTPSRAAGGGPPNFSTHLPDKIAIELMEVNFQDAMEWAEARVRFFPNGTCDEFKMLLYRPDTSERRLVTLEVVTALADVESDLNKMRTR